MTTRTQAELINEILENLGVLAAGQTAEVEDVTRVQEKLPSIRELLSATEVAYIANMDGIEQAAFVPLAAICAYECRAKFGITGQEAAELKIENDKSVADLKKIYRGRPTYKTLSTEFM